MIKEVSGTLSLLWGLACEIICKVQFSGLYSLRYELFVLPVTVRDLLLQACLCCLHTNSLPASAPWRRKHGKMYCLKECDLQGDFFIHGHLTSTIISHSLALKSNQMGEVWNMFNHLNHPWHEQYVRSSFWYKKVDAFLHSSAYILPAEFTIVECTLLCLKQLITKHHCPQLQLPPLLLSFPHTLHLWAWLTLDTKSAGVGLFCAAL